MHLWTFCPLCSQSGPLPRPRGEFKLRLTGSTVVVTQHGWESQHLCEERRIRFRSRVIIAWGSWPDMTSTITQFSNIIFTFFVSSLQASRHEIPSGSLIFGGMVFR